LGGAGGGGTGAGEEHRLEVMAIDRASAQAKLAGVEYTSIDWAPWTRRHTAQSPSTTP